MLTDLHKQKQAIYGGFASTTQLSTAATTTSVVTPKTSARALRIQKLTVIVTTGSAGKTWTFASVAGTVVTGALDMSTAGTMYSFDFGPKGIVFATNDPLRVTISAAGAAGDVVVEGYQQ